MLINKKLQALLSLKKDAENASGQLQSEDEIESAIISEVFGGPEISNDDYRDFTYLSELVNKRAPMQMMSMAEDDADSTHPKRKNPKD